MNRTKETVKSTKRAERKTRWRFNKDSKGVRTVAFGLAVVLVLSFLNANISSIINLLEARAAVETYTHDKDDTYPAKLTLYDYLTDNEYKSTAADVQDNTGASHSMTLFNKALYKAGYSSRAEDALEGRTWDNQNLYYFPLYQGVQHTNIDISYMWNDPTYNYSFPANSHAYANDTGNAHAAAAQGLVDKELVNGMITQGGDNGGSRVALPYFSEEFLDLPMANYTDDTTAQSANKKIGVVMNDLKFNFVKRKNSDYYEYDSFSHASFPDSANSEMGLYYNSGEKTFYAGDKSGTYTQRNDYYSHPGFFPWNYVDTNKTHSDFAYGAKFEIPFTMSETGKLANGDATKFEFRGDDDVWVFIDGHLVLDLGGAHGYVSGEIDFTKGNAGVYVSQVKNTSYYNHFTNLGSGDFASPGWQRTDAINTLFQDTLGLYSDPTVQHTLTVFYLERGAFESNCKIAFNFMVSDMVSVVNKLDTGNVNPEFLEKTLAVANSEAIGYMLQSNSNEELASPDAGPIDSTKDFTVKTTQTKYKIKFYNGDNSSMLYDDATLKKYGYTDLTAGTKVKLPDGYKVSPVPDNMHMAGWVQDPSSTTILSEYPVNASDADGDNTIYFYPVFKKDALTLEKPSAPTLVYISGQNLDGYSDSGNAGVANSGLKHLINYTHYTSDDSVWFKDNSITHDNNDPQYPWSGHYSTLLNGAELGDRMLKLKLGYLYVIDYGSYSITRYSHSSSDFSSSTSVTDWNTWLSNYESYYNNLNTAYQLVQQLYATDNENFSTQKTKYEEALEAYKKAVPGGTLDTSKIPSVSYSYTNWAYSSDTVTFYIYSETDTPAVQISNASTHDLDPTQSVSVSGPAAPPITAPTEYSGNNYYQYTAPKTITRTGTATGYGLTVTESVDTDISFQAGGDAMSLSAARIAVATSSRSYYCYYTGENWAYIDDPAVEYTASEYKIVWFYGINPVSVSTSAYSGAFTTTAMAVEDITDYYYAKVPATVSKTCHGVTKESTTDISLSYGTSTITTTTVPSGTAMCYFPNENRWYALKTVVAQAPCWERDDARTWWYNTMKMYVYTNPDHPFSDTTRMMLAVPGYTYYKGSSSETCPKYYYAYVPSVSSGVYRFQDDTTGSTQQYYSNDVSGITSDTFLEYGSQATSTSKISFNAAANIGSGSNFYSYTATAKATSLLSSSGGNNNTEATEANGTSGQFVNKNDGDYDKVDGVNFKLYNGDNPNDTEAEYVVRRTGSDGKFYIHFGQSAKFTYQFKRETGMKIAQTGDSSFYDAKNVVIPPGELKANSSNSSTGLYNRYTTRWTLTDGVGTTMTSTRDDYNVYRYNGGNNSTIKDKDGNVVTTVTGDFLNTTYSNAGAIYFNNIAANVSEKSNLSVTAAFTNSVIAGSLYIQKVLDDDALAKIQEYVDAGNSTYTDNLYFTFNETFSKVFGGNSAAEGYNGDWYLVDLTGTKYYNSAGNWYTRVIKDDGTVMYQLNGTGPEVTADVADVVKPRADMRLYYADASKEDGTTSVVTGGTVKMIKIEGIPVETEYTITETVPTPTGNEPKFKASSTDYFKVDSNANAIDQSSSAKIIPVLKSAVNNVTGVIAAYYEVASGSYYGADAKAKVTNSPVAYYIILQKNIDQLYYHTVKGTGDTNDTDNPAKLANSDVKVGGATGAVNDANGYQDATKAEQSFIFTIVDSWTEGETPKTNTFREVISFQQGEELVDGRFSITAKPNVVIIKAKPDHTYTITEESGWSWKYAFASSTLNGTDKNSTSITVVANDDCTQDYTPKSYTKCCALVVFNNEKNSAKKDVEGDTSRAENTATRTA